jgi:FkbM family methyltransferase
MLTKIIDSSGFNAVIKGKYGYYTYNKNDIFIGKSLEYYGEYSDFEVKLFEQICEEGDIVIEVGANIGAHTLPLSQFVGKQGLVYAFEPQRIIFQTLCANLAINSISNVICHPYAVAAEEGFFLVPRFDYNEENNYGGIEISKYSRGEKVRVVKLDDFIHPLKLTLLKIDVEGMEYEVINGAKNIIERCKPILYVENDRKEKSSDLISLIRSLNYKMYWHFPPFFNPDNFAHQKEKLFEKDYFSSNMLCVHESSDFEVENFTKVTEFENTVFK